MGERRGTYRVLWGNPKERGQFEDLGIDGRILKWIFKEWNGQTWIGFIWLMIVTSGGLL